MSSSTCLMTLRGRLLCACTYVLSATALISMVVHQLQFVGYGSTYHKSLYIRHGSARVPHSRADIAAKVAAIVRDFVDVGQCVTAVNYIRSWSCRRWIKASFGPSIQPVRDFSAQVLVVFLLNTCTS